MSFLSHLARDWQEKLHYEPPAGQVKLAARWG
jgi:hypothetical protein